MLLSYLELVDLSTKKFPEMLTLLMNEHGFAMKPGQLI